MVKGQRTEFINFLKKLYADDECTYWMSARKYYRDYTLTFNNFFEEPLTLTDLGYTTNKMTTLRKNYVDDELLSLGRNTLLAQLEAEKAYVSASFSFITGRKNASFKSYCLMSAAVIKDKTGVSINVFYRATEATKKFGADLIMLRDVFTEYIPKELLQEIKYVRFYLSLMYVVPIYYPLAYLLGVPLAADKDSMMHRWCKRHLDRASEGIIQPKFGPTKRIYENFRRRTK
jgi:superfamily I DNA and/or RNA helicase